MQGKWLVIFLTVTGKGTCSFLRNLLSPEVLPAKNVKVLPEVFKCQFSNFQCQFCRLKYINFVPETSMENKKSQLHCWVMQIYVELRILKFLDKAIWDWHDWNTTKYLNVLYYNGHFFLKIFHKYYQPI